MDEAIHRVISVSPQSLARLLDCESGPTEAWLGVERNAMFQHQMAASLAFDMASLAPRLAERLERIEPFNGKATPTFGDLFHSSRVPLQLLALVKDFAEINLVNPESPMPAEIARVLFFGCLAKALAQYSTRLGYLDDDLLRTGFNWVLGQAWVDEPTREVIRAGLCALKFEPRS